MFKFRSNSGQKYSLEPEPEQKCCSGTGAGIPVDLCPGVLLMTIPGLKISLINFQFPAFMISSKNDG